MAEGASAKLDGMNLARGMRRLGYNVNYWFHVKYPKLFVEHFSKLHPEVKGDIRGTLHDNPEYVFTVKPMNDELLIKFKNQGAKIIYIVEDETLSPERRSLYDFIVSSSYGWKKSAMVQFPGLPCYIIRDEQDYYTTKIHIPNSFKIVTTGHMENLKHHFNILPVLEQKYQDITIVSNWIDRTVFPTTKFDNWVPPLDYFSETHDTTMTEQFKKYDVGISTQYPYGLDSNSSRLRMLMYAGLPVIAVDSLVHQDIWCNGEETKVLLVKKESDWLDHLKTLEDYKVRQEIVNYNYGKIKKFAGIEQAALTFVRAIEQYEQEGKGGK
jgi:hypothetical protein